MIAFALFAVAALVIDVGFAILTRRQMRTATDAAVLEGLRGHDSSTDEQRRMQASFLLQQHFNDIDTPYAGPRSFGAGPVLDFSDENAIPMGDDFMASQTVQVPQDATSVSYVPTDFALNLANAENADEGNLAHGDMVSGTYLANSLSHREDSNYIRDDFQRDPSVSPGGSFLVRMRRTNNTSGLDSVAGVSSRGPALPYLFGRGTMLASSSKGSGITVRATSIADARPALLVGPTLPILDAQTTQITNIPGLAPFELNYETWQSGSGGDVEIVLATGQISGSMSGQVFGLGAISGSGVPSASETSITVVSNTGFPTSGPFEVRVDNELLLVTDVQINADSSAKWTAERGMGGTTGQPHAAGAPIGLVMNCSVGQLASLGRADGLAFGLGPSSETKGGTGASTLIKSPALGGMYVPIVQTLSDTGNLRVVGFVQAYLDQIQFKMNSTDTLTATVVSREQSIAPLNACSRYYPPADAITAGELQEIFRKADPRLAPLGYLSSLKASLLSPALVRSE